MDGRTGVRQLGLRGRPSPLRRGQLPGMNPQDLVSRPMMFCKGDFFFIF